MRGGWGGGGTGKQGGKETFANLNGGKGWERERERERENDLNYTDRSY